MPKNVCHQLHVLMWEEYTSDEMYDRLWEALTDNEYLWDLIVFQIKEQLRVDLKLRSSMFFLRSDSDGAEV